VFERLLHTHYVKGSRLNRENIVGQEEIIPLTVSIVSDEGKSLTCLIAQGDASRREVNVCERSDDHALPGGRLSDERTPRFQEHQRRSAPMEGEGGNEPMCDRVPWTRSSRTMAPCDAEPSLGGQVVHLTLPEAAPSSMGAFSLSSDELCALYRRHACALLIPPL
jgi:hypothetical protein